MLPFSDLVGRVIRQESGGNPNAVNQRSGASGLMQVMPATAASPGFGVAPLDWSRRFDATENRRFGEQYLTAMIDRYQGDQARALVAYNWGPGNADRWDGDMASLPEETRGYLKNILGSGPAAPQTAPVQQASGAAMQPDLSALDTGQTESPLSQLAAAMSQPAPQPQPLTPMQPAQGYVKQTDSLARALEAFQATRQRRA